MEKLNELENKITFAHHLKFISVFKLKKNYEIQTR